MCKIECEDPMPPGLSAYLDNIHILTMPTRSAGDIARELDTDEGAIINPLLCRLGDDVVLVLMSGDKACDASQISKIMNAEGTVSMLNEDDIMVHTGMGHDDLFPLELAERMPTIVDASLKRFDLLYSRAGNAKCLIATTFPELKSLTKAIVSYAVASPPWHPKEIN